MEKDIPHGTTLYIIKVAKLLERRNLIHLNLHELLAQPSYLLIDEAQMSCSDITFWNDFLKTAMDYSWGVKVVLAPRNGSYKSHLQVQGTPILIPYASILQSFTLSVTQPGVFLNRQEFDDPASPEGQKHQLAIASRKLDTISAATRGHCGATMDIFDHLCQSTVRQFS